MKTFSDPAGQVMRERIASAKATLDPKITAFSKLRKISLNRLEQAIVDHQGTLSDEMRYLAGLQRVRYVFYYPDSKDIVLAGPAEGWAPDLSGRIVGLTSGRPVVQLQDVVVALRTFPADSSSTPVIGCSIDPTREGLAAMQHFLRNNRPNPNEPQPFVEALRNSLGYQLVSIHGVSPKTRFAQVMVEADYRMKLIGIGLERPPVRLVSYVDRAKPSDVGRNALQRWFFVPDYQCVRVSEDNLAMELVGDGVKLIGEDEMVTAQRPAADRRPRQQGQPGVRHGLHQALPRVGRAIAGLRRAAEPHRRGHCGRLHPATGLLHQGRLEDGVFRQREGLPGRNLRHSQDGGIGRQRHLEGSNADDADRRRRADSALPSARVGPPVDRREGQGGQAPRNGRAETGQGPVVVGLTRVSVALEKRRSHPKSPTDAVVGTPSATFRLLASFSTSTTRSRRRSYALGRS